MIKVDLVTGFLGAGKTTFLKKYVKYFTKQGLRVGILENDYGAVNVDMLLLQDLQDENVGLEMVAGGCDADCHKRRFKTKLIAMAMSKYDRVIIEPSGLFDMDEFFDTLRESPLDNWYDIGSVITILDAGISEEFLGTTAPAQVTRTNEAEGTPTPAQVTRIHEAEGTPEPAQATRISDTEGTAAPAGDMAPAPDFVPSLSEGAEYVLSTQLSYSGRIILSKLDLVDEKTVEKTLEFIDLISEKMGCFRNLRKLTITKPLVEFTEEDWRKISKCGYQISDNVKKMSLEDTGFSTVYFLEPGLDRKHFLEKIEEIMSDPTCGRISRIKGFCQERDAAFDAALAESACAKTGQEESEDRMVWYEINATRKVRRVERIVKGQDVAIVIGENINEERIRNIMGMKSE